MTDYQKKLTAIGSFIETGKAEWTKNKLQYGSLCRAIESGVDALDGKPYTATRIKELVTQRTAIETLIDTTMTQWGISKQ